MSLIMIMMMMMRVVGGGGGGEVVVVPVVLLLDTSPRPLYPKSKGWRSVREEKEEREREGGGIKHR